MQAAWIALDNFTNHPQWQCGIPQCLIGGFYENPPKTLHDDDPRLADVAHVLAGGSYSDRLICTAYCASIMPLSAPPFRRNLPLPRSAKLNSQPAASRSLLAHPPGCSWRKE